MLLKLFKSYGILTENVREITGKKATGIYVGNTTFLSSMRVYHTYRLYDIVSELSMLKRSHICIYVYV